MNKPASEMSFDDFFEELRLQSELGQAVHEGNLSRIKELVQQGVDPATSNIRYAHQAQAASAGHLEVVRYFLDELKLPAWGLNHDVLSDALRFAKMDVVEYLLDKEEIFDRLKNASLMYYQDVKDYGYHRMKQLLSTRFGEALSSVWGINKKAEHTWVLLFVTDANVPALKAYVEWFLEKNQQQDLVERLCELVAIDITPSFSTIAIQAEQCLHDLVTSLSPTLQKDVLNRLRQQGQRPAYLESLFLQEELSEELAPIINQKPTPRTNKKF